MSSTLSEVTYTSVYTDSEPDEDEHELMFIQPHDPDFVSEPIYPEYIPLEDEHILPAEEQPLPPIVSPTAESPGYVAESDLEEDPEEYEEDEQLAPVDSAVVIPIDELASLLKGTEPIIPPPSINTATIRARITIRPQTSISLPPEAEVERLLAMPTPSPSPLTSLSPPSTGERWLDAQPQLHYHHLHYHHPYIHHLVDYGFADTIEAEMRYRGIREVGYGIRDTWIDLAEAVPEMAPTTLRGETLRVMRVIRREMGDMQAELLALRGQPRRAGQPGGDARVPNHQDTPRDADNHI
nr:hypothetical protein [Tanacetum cinerariifolium]